MMLRSRKFLVWFTTILFCIAAVIITKTITSEIVNLWTVVSAVYIGGNTAAKYFKDKGNE